MIPDQHFPLSRAEEAIERTFGKDRNERLRAITQLKARTARRILVNDFRKRGFGALMTWLHDVPTVPRHFLTLAEAIEWFRFKRRQYRGAVRDNHWSQVDHAPYQKAYRERLVIARYFAMHGAGIWTEARQWADERETEDA